MLIINTLISFCHCEPTYRQTGFTFFSKIACAELDSVWQSHSHKQIATVVPPSFRLAEVYFSLKKNGVNLLLL